MKKLIILSAIALYSIQLLCVVEKKEAIERKETSELRSKPKALKDINCKSCSFSSCCCDSDCSCCNNSCC